MCYLYYMINDNKILIGGKALVQLGSSRSTNDTDYLVSVDSKEMFIHDTENNIDYINANGHKFFAEIFTIEAGKEIASAQSLLELKSFSLVQHCLNGNWGKADDCEYDIKFLVRTFNLKSVSIVKKYISKGELSEIQKVISSVRF